MNNIRLVDMDVGEVVETIHSARRKVFIGQSGLCG